MKQIFVMNGDARTGKSTFAFKLLANTHGILVMDDVTIEGKRSCQLVCKGVRDYESNFRKEFTDELLVLIITNCDEEHLELLVRYLKEYKKPITLLRAKRVDLEEDE